ncbi:MAG: thiamine ABC transporter substrate binding subunit [Alphaproteobacteria bacterium]|nr:thiamine ABC transporter substrate binding subunit [Alphaproteobacteria bacterium]
MRTLLIPVMAIVAVMVTSLSLQAAETPVLTIYTYDSFASEWGPGPAIEKTFEAECACDVNFVALDSSIGILGRVQLEGPSSKADIVLGLDTNLMKTARDTGLFAPHGVSLDGRTSLPVAFADDHFVPFDWGYFAFVYNSEAMATPPTSLKALVNAPDDIRIVIQDPRTSTPGLGLLLWVRSVYGDDAGEAWASLSPRIVTVTKGWWDAYSMFLDGEADMVLSYSTSPAYHIVVDGTDKYRAAAFDEGHYMQVEVAAMLKNAPQPELARQFMDFILSSDFQSVIPTKNWMYPAGKADLPEAFDGLIQPVEARLYSPEDVAANKSAWVGEWQRALSQ